ncbi:unnamed protein product [Brassica rapa subsp. trilocularis]
MGSVYPAGRAGIRKDWSLSLIIVRSFTTPFSTSSICFG